MRIQPLGVVLMLCTVVFCASAGDPPNPSPSPAVEVRVGLPQSLFRDVSAETAITAAEPLMNLLQAKSGISGHFVLAPDSETLAKQIDAGKMHVGIMQGIEYAWLKDRYPRLKPVLVACNEDVALRACLLARVDGGIRSITDLKGKPFAVPKFTLNHCYFFLDASVRAGGHDPAAYFAPATRPANPEAALDAVVDGQAPATVVDSVALQIYRERKPGRARRLHVVEESSAYPVPVFIAAVQGVDAKTIDGFRDGMTQAHRNLLGRQVLMFWRLSRFEQVPENYDRLLSGVLKVHPEPFTPAAFASGAREKLP